MGTSVDEEGVAMARTPLELSRTPVHRPTQCRDSEVSSDTEAVSDTPPTVTGAMVADLRERLDDAALVELTMMAAVEDERSRCNSTLGPSSQGFAERCEVPDPILRVAAAS